MPLVQRIAKELQDLAANIRTTEHFLNSHLTRYLRKCSTYVGSNEEDSTRIQKTWKSATREDGQKTD